MPRRNRAGRWPQRHRAVHSRPIAGTLALLAAGYGLACTNNSANQTAPTAPAALSSHGRSAAQPARAEGTHAHPLTAIIGEGTGLVNISPEASQEGFSVEVQVSVRGSEPNAEFLLTRS